MEIGLQLVDSYTRKGASDRHSGVEVIGVDKVSDVDNLGSSDGRHWAGIDLLVDMNVRAYKSVSIDFLIGGKSNLSLSAGT